MDIYKKLSFICVKFISTNLVKSTEDSPLISIILRKKLKIYSIIVTLLIGIIILNCNDHVFLNIIIFSLLEESFLITPIAYYIFNRKYNNYKNI